ncbi:TldD/PmbA family protein [Noviherbaspirillum galbum]|uniref:TldE/PmbA family protein n=1 Tax=Noviherbaspirillum galbum TaxID=2709383 RepID=A0A6B3SLT4_9BURK|nr:metallopeptidase TldD-related protein [Noviherbaspirillum galbum]NEX61707.1 TldE/PmbA family protein [Noviherbaspirillum galbum]
MQQYFNEVAAFLAARLRGQEQFKCWLEAESSDFVRFNRSAVRQPGHVRQIMLTVDLADGLRHAAATLSLGGSLAGDQDLLGNTIGRLRTQIASLPEDPYLLPVTAGGNTERITASRLPSGRDMADQMLDAARGVDMVGILAAGPVYRGFANSLGQRNWHEMSSFNADWSLYLARDKAVKNSYAGFDWDGAAFRSKFDEGAAQLDFLRRDPVTITPGGYRAYLSPTALGEIIGMLNWDGFSEKAFRTRQSTLRGMRAGERRLHPCINLRENTRDGLAPAFQADGFIKPGKVDLIRNGELAGSMISPRTAREYGIDTNGADAGEAMSSVELDAGTLPRQHALRELGTGVYISNLWYLNFSDRASCRMTGMTRFASFWVENGEIKAPLNVMRFDDSLFRILGDKLIGLTDERDMLIDNETYGGRHVSSARVPGALVGELAFVL